MPEFIPNLKYSGTDKMVRAYLAAAEWTEEEQARERGEPLTEWAPDAIAKAEAACSTLREKAGDRLNDVSDSQAGHDLWLTRNRHGTGFWARDIEHGDALTEIAESMGETDCYVGDDGLVYFS